MARYIDADSLYRRVKTHTNPYGKPALDYKSGVKVLDMINQEPTADVAPKSEVDKWYHEYHAIKDELKQEKMYHRETEKLADKYFNELQTAKSEVAREKATRKAMLFDAIDTFRNLLCMEAYLEYEDTRKHYAVIIDDVDRIHDELKKKYTGGKNEL